MLTGLLWGIHIIICVVLIIVVLLQAGRGSTVGFALGGGASQTVFGASGGKNFFARLTTGLAVCFMVTSIVLSLISSRSGQSYRGLMNQIPAATGSPAEDVQEEKPAESDIPAPPPVE